MLREAIRSLQAWHSLFEAQEASDVLTAPDGHEWCLWDVAYLYGQRVLLTPRMATAIQLCLYENLPERRAAVLMGIAESNPVATYATVGLTHLISMADRGELPGYQGWELVAS